MHGPTCTFWANLTSFSLQERFFAEAEAAAAAAEAMEVGAAAAMLKALMLNVSATLRSTLAGFNSSLPMM